MTSAASWEYEIAYTIPWILQKVFKRKTLELQTKVEVDTVAGVMKTTMRNTSQLMGVNIVEETIFAAVSAGTVASAADEKLPIRKWRIEDKTSWQRKLRVSVPTWVPSWVETKSKTLFREGCARSCDVYRELLRNIPVMAPQILCAVGTKNGGANKCSAGAYTPPTHAFLDKLGVAAMLRHITAEDK